VILLKNPKRVCVVGPDKPLDDHRIEEAIDPVKKLMVPSKTCPDSGDKKNVPIPRMTLKK
jgi:hypothetical protein